MAPNTQPQPLHRHINDSDLTLDRYPSNIFLLTMRKAPENRLSSTYCRKLISAYNSIRTILNVVGTPSCPGAVITSGSDAKFWCTGLELDEADTNPHANTEGFYPLLATLMDFPFPTVALITGHTFGGAGPFALSHDYRVMNSKRGYFSMPPIELGLWFPGIGQLPRMKLRPQVARRMLLEAERWTGKQALEDGIVDYVAEPEEMLGKALEVAAKWAPKARMGVYAALRNELYGEAGKAFREISYVHGRMVGTQAKAKI